ncbi:MAG TPA: glycine cleavage system aminomethyltransferase GcvT [Myxococcota bacterium]|nr:glycine cleavage system aminomethyltransferase GcvT [Myxococcota bacterium]
MSERGAPFARTPLWSRHVDAGAKLVPFAGFEMPVSYSSILDEHRAVRSRAGLFDVSHMGELRLRGPGALELAQRLFTNDLASAPVGRVRYGLLCLENGGVVDDVTVYRTAPGELLFCVNAANIAADHDWFHTTRARMHSGAEIADESEATGLLALQGPAAAAIVAKLLPAGAGAPRPWHFAEARLGALPVLLSRTGYTGEDGFEIFVDAARAGALWDLLRDAGGDQLAPAGLGARDTLRTEAALPLYGHELDRQHDPIEAGLERFVALGRGFTGEPALRERVEAGPRRKLVGMVLEGRSVARPGFRIATERGDGVVTSGTFGPTVDRSIALGYAPAGLEAGARAHVEIRGKPVPCEIVATPFYRRKRG